MRNWPGGPSMPITAAVWPASCRVSFIRQVAVLRCPHDYYWVEYVLRYMLDFFCAHLLIKPKSFSFPPTYITMNTHFVTFFTSVVLCVFSPQPARVQAFCSLCSIIVASSSCQILLKVTLNKSLACNICRG